jgi:hypothetical protein
MPLPGPRAPQLEFSFLAQIDGLLFALLGVRIERDVFAPSASSAVCSAFGCPPWLAWSTFIGLFAPPVSQIGLCVEIAARHHAAGVFVVPRFPDHGPLLPDPKGKRQPRSWFKILKDHSVLSFAIADPIVTDHGVESTPSHGMVVFFSEFFYAGRFKAKRRKEKHFSISRMRGGGLPRSGKLGVCPFLPHRVSPLAEVSAPSRADDQVSASVSLPMSDVVLPSPPNSWVVPVLEKWAVDFPDRKVASLAVKAAGIGIKLDFVGDTSKAVIRKNSPSIVGKELELRKDIMAEVAKSRIIGPLRSIPFPSKQCPFQPRSCPVRTIKKKKHDPLDLRHRIVNNFAAGTGKGAVNDLTWNPMLLSFHCSPSSIRDRMADAGIGCFGWAGDVSECFRGQSTHPSLLFLFLYVLSTVEFGQEFFVDLCNPFGWKAAEWG